MPTKKRSARVKLFANVNHVLDTLEMNSANLVSEYYHQVATTGLVPHGFKAAQPTPATQTTTEAQAQQMTMMSTIDDLDALYANLDKC